MAITFSSPPRLYGNKTLISSSSSFAEQVGPGQLAVNPSVQAGFPEVQLGAIEQATDTPVSQRGVSSRQVASPEAHIGAASQ